MDSDLFISSLIANQNAAARLFAGDGLRRTAMVMAGASPRAIDYVVQAPVLVLLARAGFGKVARCEYRLSVARDRLMRIAVDFSTAVSSGPKLRDVLRRYWDGKPLGCDRLGLGDGPALNQLRLFKGSAFRDAYIDAVLQLARINPSALAQAVPRNVSAQRAWLCFLSGWCARWHQRREVVGEVDPFQFEAVAVMSSKEFELGRFAGEHIADYMIACRIGGVPAPRAGWTWADLSDAVAQWEQSRGTGTVQHYNCRCVVTGGHHTLVEPELLIDYSPLSNDPVEIDGLQFVPLRSAAALAEEGQAMGHCVGSYAADVHFGASRIFSVRGRFPVKYDDTWSADPGWTRIATLELRMAIRGSVVPYTINQLKGYRNRTVPPIVRAACQSLLKKYDPANAGA